MGLIAPTKWPLRTSALTSGGLVTVVAYTESGPEARALLTYSQSANPDSDHFADQTRRFSEKAWRPVLFKSEDIEADPEFREEQITERSTL